MSRIPAFALVFVAALGLVGCAPGDDGLDDALAEIESALERHELPELVDGGHDFAALVEPLAGHPLDLTLGEAEREGSVARVPAVWSWDLDGREWTYEQTLELSRDGEPLAWTLPWSPSLVADGLKEGETLAVTREYPGRAPILGGDGEPIVTERPVTRYGLDKSWIEPAQVEQSARDIAAALQVDADEFAARAAAMGELAFVEAIVLRPEDAAARVAPGFTEIPGASAIEATMQLAPTRTFAREVLGTVGEATAEIIESSDGEIATGEQTGLSGLQAEYDDQLRGEPAVTVTASTGEEGAEPRVLAEWPAADGEPLQTTLDIPLQQRAESVLARVESASALVAIRPSTGEVLAAANGEANGGFDAATTGRYAPGSTFKVVTTLALLRSGMAPDDAVACAEETTVDGYTFHNYGGYPVSALGGITLREAVAHSCNTAFVGLHDRVTDADLRDAAEALGVGGPDDAGSQTEHAANMIGQGIVTETPLGMATVAASVAAGRTVSPFLTEAPEEAESSLTAEEAETLRGLMHAVVTEGSGTALAGLGSDVGAKTGTAEFGQPDGNGELASHAWMIAFQGDLAVAVFVERGDGGANTAGPLMADFLDG
ncbi:penicillin-binding transpeptidase domain-containing protein [Microbacterium sp. Marseille-Q6965]|uniref:penicillin-binding transpeptidase domain-containing protein n=1 Tax=Microbacterium sp. Marseille-Q6965 TaxID=2965072 RepID=UPI0021B71DD7|nr:penicillin-binding transpeptidase domain-containing protein [Microbacterium sp. Marseille-Q6965]